jgi:hypothetical protein
VERAGRTGNDDGVKLNDNGQSDSLVAWLFTDHGVVGMLTSTIRLLFVLTLTVATLGIEPRRRSLKELGGGRPKPQLLRRWR